MTIQAAGRGDFSLCKSCLHTFKSFNVNYCNSIQHLNSDCILSHFYTKLKSVVLIASILTMTIMSGNIFPCNITFLYTRGLLTGYCPLDFKIKTCTWQLSCTSFFFKNYKHGQSTRSNYCLYVNSRTLINQIKDV